MTRSIELYIEQIYNRSYSKAVNYANQFLHDTELSKEVVQDAFLVLWERREKLILHENIEYYLLTVVRNKIFNLLKHRQRVAKKMGSEVSLNDRLSMVALNDDSSQKVLCSELSRLVDRTLDSMSRDIVETFRMSREEGLSYKEIAEKQDVSVKTIEYRISKALKLLNISLADYLAIIIWIKILG